MARGLLVDLLELRAHGLQAPLPLPVDTAFAYATAAWSGRPVPACRRAASQSWTSDWSFPKEDADPWHVRAFGEHADYTLLASPPRAGEDGPHRLGHLAWRLWGPLIDGGHEQIRGT